jgi:large conductance mechanosensitive channel
MSRLIQRERTNPCKNYVNNRRFREGVIYEGNWDRAEVFLIIPATISPRRNMMSIIKEFKEFISRGNVVDMAVGVIIGGAFGKIVTSLVNDVVMPPIGLILGGVNFKDLGWTLKEAVGDKPAVMIKYGMFINTILEFLIVAMTIFLIIKTINHLKKPVCETPPATPEPSKEELLLGEIRDLLKSKS